MVRTTTGNGTQVYYLKTEICRATSSALSRVEGMKRMSEESYALTVPGIPILSDRKSNQPLCLKFSTFVTPNEVKG